MSGDRPLLPPPLEPGTFRAADGTVRSFQSSRFASNDRAGDTPSERLYTVIQQFHHDLDRLSQHLFATSTRTSLSTGSMASGSGRDLRPRFNRDPQPSINPLSSSAASPDSPSLPPLRSLDQRARVPPATFSGSASRSSRYRPAGRYLDRFRSHLGATLDDLHRNIHDTDAQLRTFMDFGMATNIPPPTVSPPLQGHDASEDTRRTKRRKLNPDRHIPAFKGFRYGRYGQVEPGQLTMEIVSCDGGLHSDEHSYAPENILKNDASVYCTKSNRCNIVLKHQGGTVFSLQELVIRAPGSKFSCPVREGMIFVSMDSDDLLTRTAQYQIQYQPSRPHRPGTVHLRPEDGSRFESRPLRAYSYGADDDEGEDDDDDDDDEENSRTAQIPPEFTTSSLPYNVTTVCSEDEGEDEDPSFNSRPPRHPPRRLNRYVIGTLPIDSDSDDTDFSRTFGGPYGHWPPAPEQAAARRRYRVSRLRGGGAAVLPAAVNDRAGAGSGSSSGPSRSDMTLEEAQEASQIATQEAVRAVGGELMAPLAHFFIEKDKNKCTVRFDPPVSGRFILLKMWSPHQDPQKNIDIQAVVAKGFAGPRFSPAIDLA
ncbi:hypothetical protein VTH06DRAFT_3417 [Thermothelomyces fergusii]